MYRYMHHVVYQGWCMSWYCTGTRLAHVKNRVLPAGTQWYKLFLSYSENAVRQ